MPAPTALKRAENAPPSDIPLPEPDQEEELLLDVSAAMPSELVAPQETTPQIPQNDDDSMQIDEEGRPRFAPSKDVDPVSRSETRKIPIPPHRMTPLKQHWVKIYSPLVEHLRLQVRMNIKRKAVELRTSKSTTDPGALQKGEDFIRAFTLGFDVDDAIALLRLDDLYILSFEIKDVKNLSGDHHARALGRLVGKDGKTKFAIENATRTRVVVAGESGKVHILGSYSSVNIAKTSICDLILGKQPSKVYGNLRTVAARMKERF